MPSMMMFGTVTILTGGGSDHPGAATLAGRTERRYAMIEARLGEADYLAGDAFTAADIMTVFALTTMRAFGPRDLARHPNILAYLTRIGTRPAYQRAMAKGDRGLPPLLASRANLGRTKYIYGPISLLSVLGAF